MKRILLSIVFVIIGILLIAYPLKITSWDINKDIKKLNSIHASIDYVNRDTQTIIIYVYDDSEYQKILVAGFDAVKIPDIAKEYADKLWEETKDTRDPLRAYYTLSEYETFLQNTATQYPNICQLVQFGTTVQNRPLYFMKISDNVNIEENEPEFRYISSMHGDEVVGYDMCIRLIQLLTSQYTTDTRIANIVNNTEIWINPMLNPDGYNAHSRYNANGIDLNRNFPLPIGSQHPDGNTWQPETIAVMNHGNAHNFNLSANFHGGALVANYPWDYIYPLCPDNDWFIQAALTYSVHNLPMYNSPVFDQGITNGADWYIATGTLQDWSYAYTSDMDLTIELSNTKWPSSSQLDTFWSQNQESMLSYLEFVQKGLHGTVTNSTGTPLLATIHINTSGKDILTDPDAGDYHRVLLHGNYSVTATADGYQSSTVDVVIPANTAVVHNFVLQPVITTNLSGTVINSTGSVVSSANVKLTFGTNILQTTTDTNGTFSFDSIPVETYNILISAAGYGIFNSSLQLIDGENIHTIVLPSPLFFDDFENGLSNWSVQSPWIILTQTSNHVLCDSPSGNYANNLSIDAQLTNPVSLINVTNAVLSFDIKHALEDNYDYLFVMASANGTDWSTLMQFTGTITSWQSVSLTLDNYTGSNLYLKFRLYTDTGVTADGVYIDNIMISGLTNNLTVYGDTDANWLINIYDVQNVLEYSVGNNPIPLIDSVPWETFRLEAADVDNDNTITATDAYYIYDKIYQYNGAFPAQGGIVYTFGNPVMNFELTNNEISISALYPEDIQSLNVTFSSDTNLSLQNVNWQITDEQSIKANSADIKSIGMIKLTNAVLPSLIATIPYYTSDNIIHCSGLVNNNPINLDLTTVGTHDMHDIPLITDLEYNYPNPFNPETTIRYSLAKDNTPVSLIVYNSKGQEVKTLINSIAKSGYHSIVWNGTDNQNKPLSNGIYFYRLKTPEKTFTRKMVMLK